MSKRIIIHIGPPKTGTSAIQNWLLTNRTTLLEQQSIYYPSHDIGANGVSSGNMLSVLKQNEIGSWEVSHQLIASLLSEFEQTGADTLLLSSEYFFYVSEDLARAIPTALFIAYLRCPLETFESAYNQGIKRHHRTEKLVSGKNLHTTTMDILRQKIGSIGKERFQVRAYFPAEIPKFDLLDDFLSLFGIKNSTPVMKTNGSYCYEALQVKRWLNQFALGNLDTELDLALQSMEGGTDEFFLLPEEWFYRYKKQCIQAITAFKRECLVINGLELVDYVRNRAPKRYVNQDFEQQQFMFVGQYLEKHYRTLFNKLMKRLYILVESRQQQQCLYWLSGTPLLFKARLQIEKLLTRIPLPR